MAQSSEEIGAKVIFMVAVFIGLILVFFLSIFIVKPGEEGIVFNRITGLKEKTYDEGLHFKIPIVEKSIKMNIRKQKQEELATSASKDLQDVSTTVAVNFVVDKTRLQEVYRAIGKATTDVDYMQTEIMNPIIQESVKAITARYAADELITKRPEVKQQIEEDIRERLETHGITVFDVSITEFKFSDTFTTAIESKVRAEQEALEAERILKRIEIEAQQMVAEAKGQAEAIRIINQQLIRSPDYINFLFVDKWDGIMPLAVGGGSLIITPSEKRSSSSFFSSQPTFTNLSAESEQ